MPGKHLVGGWDLGSCLGGMLMRAADRHGGRRRQWRRWRC